MNAIEKIHELAREMLPHAIPFEIVKKIEAALLEARRDGYEECKSKYEVWGTNECNTDDCRGRITLYYMSGLCTACESAALEKEKS